MRRAIKFLMRNYKPKGLKLDRIAIDVPNCPKEFGLVAVACVKPFGF
jgi:hypothetical protein